MVYKIQGHMGRAQSRTLLSLILRHTVCDSHPGTCKHWLPRLARVVSVDRKRKARPRVALREPGKGAPFLFLEVNLALPCHLLPPVAPLGHGTEPGCPHHPCPARPPVQLRPVLHDGLGTASGDAAVGNSTDLPYRKGGHGVTSHKDRRSE